MNNQLSVLVPFFSTNTSETSEEDDIFYEDKGTLEEILLHYGFTIILNN